MSSSKRYLNWRRSKKGLSYRIFLEQEKSSKKRGHPPPSYSLSELRAWFATNLDFDIMYTVWVSSNFDPLLRPTCDRYNNFRPYSFSNICVKTLANNREKHHKDVLNGIDQRTCKGVTQYSLDGVWIQYFYSQQAASRATGATTKGIRRVCQGLQTHAKGFLWEAT